MDWKKNWFLASKKLRKGLKKRKVSIWVRIVEKANPNLSIVGAKSCFFFLACFFPSQHARHAQTQTCLLLRASWAAMGTNSTEKVFVCLEKFESLSGEFSDNFRIQVIQCHLFIPCLEVAIRLWKGHLTIPKRAQRIARMTLFGWLSFLFFVFQHWIYLWISRGVFWNNWVTWISHQVSPGDIYLVTFFLLPRNWLLWKLTKCSMVFFVEVSEQGGRIISPGDMLPPISYTPVN